MKTFLSLNMIAFMAVPLIANQSVAQSAPQINAAEDDSAPKARKQLIQRKKLQVIHNAVNANEGAKTYSGRGSASQNPETAASFQGTEGVFIEPSSFEIVPGCDSSGENHPTQERIVGDRTYIFPSKALNLAPGQKSYYHFTVPKGGSSINVIASSLSQNARLNIVVVHGCLGRIDEYYEEAFHDCWSSQQKMAQCNQSVWNKNFPPQVWAKIGVGGGEESAGTTVNIQNAKPGNYYYMVKNESVNFHEVEARLCTYVKGPSFPPGTGAPIQSPTTVPAYKSPDPNAPAHPAPKTPPADCRTPQRFSAEDGVCGDKSCDVCRGGGGFSPCVPLPIPENCCNCSQDCGTCP